MFYFIKSINKTDIIIVFFHKIYYSYNKLFLVVIRAVDTEG